MRNGFWLFIYIIKKHSCTDKVITELINTARLHRKCGRAHVINTDAYRLFSGQGPSPLPRSIANKNGWKKTILYFQRMVRKYECDYRLSTVLPTTRCLNNGRIRGGAPSTPIIAYIVSQSLSTSVYTWSQTNSNHGKRCYSYYATRS